MITRNNYEEFFLLYVDNELSPAERQAVERFVDEHPDLKEEWELLLQCRISPDESPSFPGKEQLLRSDDPIHAGNYESWFLAYVDNELDAASRLAVIDFIRRHPEKNTEWQQLQRTVSTPDLDIVFPDKDLLYREEGARRRKIAWLPFARVAVAALILGAVSLLIFHPFRAKEQLASTGNGTISHPNPDTPATAVTSPIIKKSAPDVTSAPPRPYYSANKDDGQQIASVSHKDDGQQIASISRKEDGKQKDRISHKEDRQIASIPHKDDRTVAPVMVNVDPVRPNTVDADPGRDLAVVDPATIDRTAKLPVTLAVAGSRTQHDAPARDAIARESTTNRNASFATQALLSEASYLDSPGDIASPRKNKWRGIFRKVTRVLEKPAARVDDDNKKVTIGGFQFALE